MADDGVDAGIRGERRTEAERESGHESDRPGYVAPGMDVRDDDLEPHSGLRYIARLFKIMAILLLLLMVAEVILALVQQGQPAIPQLLVNATRLVVWAGLMWGAGDMALMLIESNHDLRATRILVGRLNLRLQRLEQVATGLRGGPSTPGAGPNLPPPLPGTSERRDRPR
ncbi:MAG TPA: hypothetical protein VLK84_28595 [Longimicrobium sp.]|nr:hypothetical protein [Longimicrobium sp.]